MNAVTETTATEVAQLQGSLSELLTAIANRDGVPRVTRADRSYAAGELVQDVVAQMAMTKHQRFTHLLTRDPVRRALLHAVTEVGERLNEIGGLWAMQSAMRRIEDADHGRRRERRTAILDKCWDGVGAWRA